MHRIRAAGPKEVGSALLPRYDGGVMAFPSKAVANYFLTLGQRDSIPLSPMKVQKLVYFAHGWHLALTGQPLINEQVEAWQYGPVVDTLFHEFKIYGNQPIDDLATSYDWKSETWFAPNVDDPDYATCINVPLAKKLMDRVWDTYGQISAIRLSNMTHEPGGPWDLVVKEYKGQVPKGTDIPWEAITKYFRAQRPAASQT